MQEENPAYAEVPSGDFLSLALLVAWLGLSACTSGMHGRSIGPSEPRSSGQHYAHLLGQRYRTAVDLYLFTFSADPD